MWCSLKKKKGELTGTQSAHAEEFQNYNYAKLGPMGQNIQHKDAPH